jgi:dihydrofolate reductase
MKPCIAIIVARASNGVIGCKNRLPWRLSNDLQYFRRHTTGNVVIMGRVTYESIGKPLPNRINVVVTRSADWQAEGVVVVHSLDQAIEAGTQHCLSLAAASGPDQPTTASHGLPRLFIIGGAELYRQALPLANEVLLTEVWAVPEGDAWFEPLPEPEWQEVSREHHEADEKNDYPHDFVRYERRLYA